MDPPPLAATLVNASAVLLTGETGVVASLSVSGGDGAYTYSVGGDFAVSADGLLSLASARSNAATLTATVTIEDSHDNTAPVNAFLTLTIAEPVSFIPRGFAISLTTYANSVPFTILRASLSGGAGARGYALDRENPPLFSGGGGITVDSGGDVIVTQTLSVRTLAAVYVRGSAEYGGAATLLMLVGALDPPDLAAAFDDSRPIVLTGYSGLVATVNSGGGLGNYGYGLIDGAGDNASFAIGATDGRLSLTDARDTPTILTAAAAVNDEHPNTPALTLSLTLRVQAGLAASFTQASVTVLTRYTGVVASVLARGGDGDYRYTLIRGGADFAVGADGLLSLRVSQSEATTLTAGLRVDAGGAETPAVTVNYTLTVVIPSALTATPANASVFVLIGYVGDVASLSVSGGVGAYTYSVGGDFAVGADGLLRLALAQSNVATLTATVTIDDEHADTTPITAGYTLLVVEQLRFASAPPVTITTYDRGEVFYTAEALGGIGDITYLRVSANPPALADNFDLFFADGEVFLQQALTTPTTLSLYIEALEQIDGTDRRATLLLTVAAVDPPPLAAALVSASAVLLTGETGVVASLSVSGGDGAYTYSVGGDFAVSADGLLSLASAQSNVATLTATVTIDDSHDNTAPASAFLTLTIAEPVSFIPRGFAISLTTYANSVPFTILRASLSGGAGARGYALDRENPPLFSGGGGITVDSGGDVIVTQTLSVRTLAAVYVRGSAEYGGAATLLMLVGALDPPDLAAVFDNSRPIVLTGYSGLVATVNSGGGLGNYGYGLIDGAGDNASFAIGATDGRLSLTDARDTPTILTAAAAVNDEHPNTPAVTLSLTLRVQAGLAASFTQASVTVLTRYTGVVASVLARGGDGDYRYTLIRGGADFAVGADGLLSLRVSQSEAMTLTAGLRVDAGGAETPAVTANYTLTVVIPSALTATPANASVFVLTGYVGDVASLSVSGGVGAYTYSVGGDFAVSADGLLRLALAQSNVATLTATVTIDDEHADTTPITAGYTLLVVEQLRFASAPPVTITTYDRGEVFYTAEALGGIGDITYLRVSANPPALADNFDLFFADGEVFLQQALTTPTTLSLYIEALEQIDGTDRRATLLLTVAAVDPPPLAATLVNASAVLLTGETGVVASLSVSGGDGAYTYSVGGDFAVSADGLLSLASARSNAATLTATVTIEDSHDNTAPVNAFLTLTIAEPVSFIPRGFAISLTTYANSVPFTILRASLSGGAGARGYALDRENPPLFSGGGGITVDSGGDVIVTQTLSVRTLAAVYVRGSAEYGGAATLLMLVGALDPPDLAAAFDDSRPIVLTGYSGLVATVNSGGGLGNYGYGLIDGAGDNASFAIGATDGRLSLTDARDTPTILTAAAAVNDEHPNTPALTLSLTLAVLASPTLVNASGAVLTRYTGAVASVANAPSGNRTLIAGGDNFTLGANGVLNLTTAIGVSSVLTAGIAVDEFSLITLGYTLTVAPCSFFSGCRPFVNFDGASAGPFAQSAWLAVSAPLALSLIAAGADVNERRSYASSNGDNDGENTPLLAAARYSRTPALASVLLDNGADVRATVSRNNIRTGFTDMGILFMLAFLNSSSDSPNDVPFVSLFLDHGAYVNQVSRRENGSAATPLDAFNLRFTVFKNYSKSAVDLINGFGAKCLAFCINVNGVDNITLAPVSFSPATVAMMMAASTTITAGNLYTVRAASGLGTLFNYRLVSTFPATLAPNFSVASVDVNNALLSLNSDLAAQNFSVFIEATDLPSGDKATLRYIRVISSPLFTNVSAAVLTLYTGAVASITNAPFGKFRIMSDDNNFAVGADGVVSLVKAIPIAGIYEDFQRIGLGVTRLSFTVAVRVLSLPAGKTATYHVCWAVFILFSAGLLAVC